MDTQGKSPILVKRKQGKRLLWGVLSLVTAISLCQFSESITTGLNNFIGPHPQLSWPTTQGNILGSELECYKPLGQGEGDWMFLVRFAYDVGGNRHSAQQRLSVNEVTPYSTLNEAEERFVMLSCGELLSPKEDPVLLRGIIQKAKYLSGQDVIVYYNHLDQTKAVIVPGLVLNTEVTYGDMIMIYSSIFFAFGGIYLLYKAFMDQRKDGVR